MRSATVVKAPLLCNLEGNTSGYVSLGAVVKHKSAGPALNSRLRICGDSVPGVPIANVVVEVASSGWGFGDPYNDYPLLFICLSKMVRLREDLQEVRHRPICKWNNGGEEPPNPELMFF